MLSLSFRTNQYTKSYAGKVTTRGKKMHPFVSEHRDLEHFLFFFSLKAQLTFTVNESLQRGLWWRPAVATVTLQFTMLNSANGHRP